MASINIPLKCVRTHGYTITYLKYPWKCAKKDINILMVSVLHHLSGRIILSIILAHIPSRSTPAASRYFFGARQPHQGLIPLKDTPRRQTPSTCQRVGKLILRNTASGNSTALGKISFVRPTYELLMEYFNNETIKFQTPVSTCQISDGPGFGPTHDLLMEYFNTETIKFQTSVSTCRISDGPGFGGIL